MKIINFLIKKSFIYSIISPNNILAYAAITDNANFLVKAFRTNVRRICTKKNETFRKAQVIALELEIT